MRIRVRVPAMTLLVLVLGACDGGAGGSGGNPFQCVGLPASTCERLLADARSQFPDVPAVSAVIRCTVAACTDVQGEASVRVDFANGRFVEYGTAWEQAVPAPNPVPPVGQPSGPQPTAE
jgi:hypothetical protein